MERHAGVRHGAIARSPARSMAAAAEKLVEYLERLPLRVTDAAASERPDGPGSGSFRLPAEYLDERL